MSPVKAGAVYRCLLRRCVAAGHLSVFLLHSEPWLSVTVVACRIRAHYEMRELSSSEVYRFGSAAGWWWDTQNQAWEHQTLVLLADSELEYALLLANLGAETENSQGDQPCQK